MEKLKDEDRRQRMLRLESIIQDPRSVANIDSLLDTIQALVADCDHPCVKRMKNVELYYNRCELLTCVCFYASTCSLVRPIKSLREVFNF